MDFKEKVVIVTGASSGIGEALAINLINLGCNVVLAARSEDKMKSLVSKFPNSSTLIVKADVSRQEDCINIIEKTIAHFGKIDILINNAGISMRAIFEELEIKVLKQLMDVNFWELLCTHAALPYLLKSKGSVVGVSSIAGFQGLRHVQDISFKICDAWLLKYIACGNTKSRFTCNDSLSGFTESNVRNAALTSDGTPQAALRLMKNLMSSDWLQKIIKGIKRRKNTLVMTLQGKLTVCLGKFFRDLLTGKRIS